MISKRFQDSMRAMPSFTDTHRCALISCSYDGSVPTLSRGELAILINRSTRTVSRWESLFGFRAERENARVLRYTLEALVGLVAMGATLNLAEAERRGLNSKAIIALAAVVAPRATPQTREQKMANVVLVAEDEDDFRLIRAWRDPALGPVLRKILRGLTVTAST